MLRDKVVFKAVLVDSKVEVTISVHDLDSFILSEPDAFLCVTDENDVQHFVVKKGLEKFRIDDER